MSGRAKACQRCWRHKLATTSASVARTGRSANVSRVSEVFRIFFVLVRTAQSFPPFALVVVPPNFGQPPFRFLCWCFNHSRLPQRQPDKPQWRRRLTIRHVRRAAFPQPQISPGFGRLSPHCSQYEASVWPTPYRSSISLTSVCETLQSGFWRTQIEEIDTAIILFSACRRIAKACPRRASVSDGVTVTFSAGKVTLWPFASVRVAVASQGESVPLV